MGRRAGVLLLSAVIALLAVVVGQSFGLLRSAEQAARIASTDRLLLLGRTTARALARGADGALLDEVRREGQLEDAYLLDAQLRPVGRPAGGPSLLRIDPDRAQEALRGQAAVGPAYRLSLEGPGPESEVLAAYLPLAGERVLVLEAGAAFIALPRRLRAAAWAATAGAVAVALLSALTVLLAVRAAARERRLYGQAERGRALSQMAAMVAHEVRNPLGTIRAGAELLREQGGGEVADDIVAEVERLTRLVGEFLSLSRDPPLHTSALDLGVLCDEVCQQLRRRFPGQELQVERTGDARAELVGDEDKLRQVLLNLGLNAVQAMRERGRLTLDLQRTRRGARVVVSDDGPGVDEQLSRRLFEPFVTNRPGGTGLGLVLSRRIAERHGGSLELLPPEPGQRGARFCLWLPRRAQPMEDSTWAESSSATTK